MNLRSASSVWLGLLGWVALGVLMVTPSAPSHSFFATGESVRQDAPPLRIWGSPEDRALLDALQSGFRRVHPQARFDNRLHGPESAFAGVYTGAADMALLSRELRDPLERMAYEWVRLGKPFLVDIANGGLSNDRAGSQLAVVVHAGNPLPSMTLEQLDAVLGTERRRGGVRIGRWTELEPASPEPEAPIQVYGPRIDSIAAQFVRRTVMRDSRKWNPAYREMETDWARIVDAVASDASGLAYVPVSHVDSRVRMVALVGEGGAAVLPTVPDVVEGRYPLRRKIPMAVAHTQAAPMPAHAADFLRFVLSPEGQAIVEAEGTYLPLSAREAADQTGRIEQPAAALARSDDADGSLAPVGKTVQLSQPLPPAYRPRRQVSGEISIWGHGSYGAHTDFVEGLTRAWQDGFRRHHPDVVFENRLHGTASAIGALYADAGDVAFLGREIWAPEIDAFREVRGYEPTGIDVMTGSYDVRNKGYAISVFVHKDNPIERLDLAQLEAIYGVDRRRGHPPVHTWGDVGVADPAWRDRPVRPHGLPIARGFADFFQTAVFKGARKWHPELREFPDAPGSRGGETDGGYRMVRAMAEDPSAIGYAGMLYPHPALKAVPLAREPGGVAVPPTLESVADHSYPLTRLITMFIDRKPGQPADPKVEEFLRYILSEEGQQAILDHGQGYLPLPADAAMREAAKLH